MGNRELQIVTQAGHLRRLTSPMMRFERFEGFERFERFERFEGLVVSQPPALRTGM